LARGAFDDNHEWWALAFSITKEGDLQEIGTIRKFHRGNRIEMSAYWSDSATGVIEWTREGVPQPPEIFSGISEATQAPQSAKPLPMPIDDHTEGDDGRGFVLGLGVGVPRAAVLAKPVTDEQDRKPGNTLGDQHKQ
jgi:hypothetical protein